MQEETFSAQKRIEEAWLGIVSFALYVCVCVYVHANSRSSKSIDRILQYSNFALATMTMAVVLWYGSGNVFFCMVDFCRYVFLCMRFFY